MSLLHLAWCYFRSRALLAMSALAIALGVAVLFAVLAVVNGFLAQVESTIRDFSGDAVVAAIPERLAPEAELQDYLDALEAVEGLESQQPRLNYYGLIGRRGARAIDDPRTTDLSGLLLVGLDRLPEGMKRLQADPQLEPVAFGPEEVPPGAILVGKVLAAKAGVGVGDSLMVISFKRGSQGYPVPVQTSFRVEAVFTTGRYDHDIDRAIVRREDLALMIGDGLGFNEIGLRGRPGLAPEQLADRAEAALLAAGLKQKGWPMLVSTWRAQGGNFLRAVENQKGILSAVFFCIVLVAAYQLVATLALTVTEKRRDIGVLGALGAAPGRIVTFFVSLGLVIAAVGSALGLLIGTWLTANLEWVQDRIFGERIFNAETYIFDHVPVAVDWSSVLILLGATLGAALVFSFLPAWLAARLNIVDALRR
ncbi:MAG: ABC transporter permease [Planctomycetes bacterium]|nr:ABC transporter permease [Planctomycetota bacterium]